MKEIEVLAALNDWLETQAAFGPLSVLPPDFDKDKLLSPQALKEISDLKSKLISSKTTEAKREQIRPDKKSVVIPPKKTKVVESPAKIEKIELDYSDLESMQKEICDCSKCPLSQTRNSFVFGRGLPEADFVIVGEAPGSEEDQQGEPFVGPSGQLLDKMLAAIGFARGEAYICNIVKCRPPGNRDPKTQEVAACIPYLRQQIQLIKPKLILAVGRVAGKTLLQNESTLREMRGSCHSYDGIPLMVTYHPSALLRNPHWKKPAWVDLQAALKLLKEKDARLGTLPTAI
jgi:uracil-DNA glycosylase